MKSGLVAAAAAAAAAMLFASRLPPGSDYFLPRRGGFVLYRGGWALFSTAWGRAAFSAVVVATLTACAWGAASSLRREVRALPRSWIARMGIMAGPLFSAVLAARLVSRALDSIQLVWFPYGSMDPREPFVSAALFALIFAVAVVAARSWVAGRRRFAVEMFLLMIVADAGAGLGNRTCGVGRPLEVPETQGRTIFVVLTEGLKGQDRDVYAVPPDVFDAADPRPQLRAIATRPRDARVIAALRALYAEETKRWDLPGLREALLLGLARADPLAPSLLLSHLSAATPSAANLATLETLADEHLWRIGPLGAAALARAFVHVGDHAAALRWASKADAAGVPLGLQSVEGGGLRRPGRIAGVLKVKEKARVALYARSAPDAPYFLDASALVAASDVDARGRFSFERLAAGRYYLAIALSGGDGRRGEVSVTGDWGDIVLDADRASFDVRPLTIAFTPR